MLDIQYGFRFLWLVEILNTFSSIFQLNFSFTILGDLWILKDEIYQMQIK